MSRLRTCLRRGLLGVALARFIVGFAGCTLMYPLDGMMAGAAATTIPDSSGGDSEADASVDASVEIANVHDHGTFEEGCSGWKAEDNATTQASDVAHGGARSCSVCSDAGGPIELDDDGFGTVRLGTYRLAAFVRRAPGTTEAISISARLQTELLFGGESMVSSAVELDDTWRQIEVTLPVTKRAFEIHSTFVAQAAGPSCFLVDDVIVTYSP